MTPVIAVSVNTSYSGFMPASATGRVLHHPRGGSFWFDAGAVCLDFAHTGGEGQYAVFETLHAPADLAEWLAEPPLAAVMTVPVTARDLAAAKALRQAIWDVAHARAAQRALPDESVAIINRAASARAVGPGAGSRRHDGGVDATGAGEAGVVDAGSGDDRLAVRPARRAHPRVRRRQLPAGVRRPVPPRRPALVRDGTVRKPFQAPRSARPAVRRNLTGAEVPGWLVSRLAALAPQPAMTVTHRRPEVGWFRGSLRSHLNQR